MKNTHIITLLLIILIFTSCKQEDTYYTVKGRLTTDCSGTPMANQELSLKQAPSIFGGGGVLGSATTDANGNFTFTYNSSECIDGQNMRINCSGPIIEDIPTQRNIDIGTIISNPICKIIYRVKINNPYTSNDTLACFNLDHPDPNGIRMAGPFHDTTFGLFSVSSINTIQYETKDYSFIKAGWDIISNNHTTVGTEITIQVQNCNTVPDTLTLIVN